jgi:hypothetical protein
LFLRRGREVKGEMDFCIYWPGLQVTARIDMPIIAI